MNTPDRLLHQWKPRTDLVGVIANLYSPRAGSTIRFDESFLGGSVGILTNYQEVISTTLRNDVGDFRVPVKTAVIVGGQLVARQHRTDTYRRQSLSATVPRQNGGRLCYEGIPGIGRNLIVVQIIMETFYIFVVEHIGVENTIGRVVTQCSGLLNWCY